MNGLKFCKKVFKYDKKVFRVDMTELNGCLKNNLNGLKIIDKNKILCLGNDIKKEFNKFEETDRKGIIWGILAFVGGYICMVSSCNYQIDNVEGMFIMGFSAVFGVLGFLCGALAPFSLPVTCLIGTTLYAPIWMHNKRKTYKMT